MKYVSIDLETTGLCHSTCQIIEFGAVIDDLGDLKPIEECPTFHCYLLPKIVPSIYAGEPYALSMHPEIFRRIAVREEGYEYIKYEELAAKFADWLREQDVNLHFTAAGKNFATFDKLFLDRVPGWNDELKIRHRVIDPAMLYWLPSENEQLPNLETCLDRAGIPKTVQHTAVEDALDVVRLIREKIIN